MPFEWNSAGVQQGILVEEVRTNLALQSCDLTNASWTKTSITTAKTATGPDGVANSATTLTASAAHGAVRQSITSASAARITSLYIKRRTGSGTIALSQGETTGSTIVTNGTFDADTNWNKAAGVTISGGVADFSAVNNSSALYQGGTTQGKAYRLTATVTVTSGSFRMRLFGGSTGGLTISSSGTYTFDDVVTTSNANMGFSCDLGAFTGTVDNFSVVEIVETSLTVTSSWTRVNTNSATVTNPGVILRIATSGDEVDVCLVQHEVGAFVTSPIPTVGATATRAVDNISLATSAFQLGATYSMFAKVNLKAAVASARFLSLNDGTTQNVSQMFNSGTVFAISVTTGNVAQSSVSVAGAMTVGNTYKMAGTVAANDFAGVRDGTAGTPDTSGTVPTVTTLSVGNLVPGSAAANAYIQQVMVVPRRIPNADLQTLTAPTP